MTTNSHPIICGTDFSENARHAANVAAALASRLGRPLLLVHVAELCAERFTTSEQQQEIKRLEKQLRAEAATLGASGAEVQQAVVMGGWAAEELIREQRERQPTLIVVSSVSKAPFDRWTLGTVSERVAEQSAAPTLVVRAAESLIAWAEGKRPLRIVVAADFSATSDAALSWADHLRKIGPCDVTAAHVYWPLEHAKRLGLKLSMSLTEAPREMQTILEKEFAKRIHDQLGHDKTNTVVRANWGRPDAPIIQLARDTEADLLVVGSSQRHGLRRVWKTSTSRGVLHHAPMNVAVVPAQCEAAHLRAIPQVGRVLIATDFSTGADRIVAQALATLSPGGSARLVHVVRAGEGFDDAAGKLRALVPEGVAARGITAEVEVLEADNAAQAISEAAEHFGADIVCVGSHGRSRAMTTILGSVAQGVLARCMRPVLVVRSAAE